MFPIRYSFQPSQGLRAETDRLFNDLFTVPAYGSSLGRWRRPAYPALNVWESGDSYHVEAECPGMRISDIDVSITGNELCLKGELKQEVGEGNTFHRRERGLGRFSRIVSMPSEIEASKVEAALKDGVLSIVLPKAESAKPKKIEVRSSN